MTSIVFVHNNLQTWAHFMHKVMEFSFVSVSKICPKLGSPQSILAISTTAYYGILWKINVTQCKNKQNAVRIIFRMLCLIIIRSLSNLLCMYLCILLHNFHLVEHKTGAKFPHTCIEGPEQYYCWFGFLDYHTEHIGSHKASHRVLKPSCQVVVTELEQICIWRMNLTQWGFL